MTEHRRLLNGCCSRLASSEITLLHRERLGEPARGRHGHQRRRRCALPRRAPGGACHRRPAAPRIGRAIACGRNADHRTGLAAAGAAAGQRITSAPASSRRTWEVPAALAGVGVAVGVVVLALTGGDKPVDRPAAAPAAIALDAGASPPIDAAPVAPVDAAPIVASETLPYSRRSMLPRRSMPLRASVAPRATAVVPRVRPMGSTE